MNLNSQLTFYKTYNLDSKPIFCVYFSSILGYLSSKINNLFVQPDKFQQIRPKYINIMKLIKLSFFLLAAVIISCSGKEEYYEYEGMTLEQLEGEWEIIYRHKPYIIKNSNIPLNYCQSKEKIVIDKFGNAFNYIATDSVAPCNYDILKFKIIGEEISVHKDLIDIDSSYIDYFGPNITNYPTNNYKYLIELTIVNKKTNKDYNNTYQKIIK